MPHNLLMEPSLAKLCLTCRTTSLHHSLTVMQNRLTKTMCRWVHLQLDSSFFLEAVLVPARLYLCFCMFSEMKHMSNHGYLSLHETITRKWVCVCKGWHTEGGNKPVCPSPLELIPQLLQFYRFSVCTLRKLFDIFRIFLAHPIEGSVLYPKPGFLSAVLPVKPTYKATSFSCSRT